MIDLEALQKQHQEYSQELMQNKIDIEELNDAIKEQQDAIRDMEIELRDLINQAITNGMDGGTDRLIYSSAKSLCRLFNKAANDLAELKGTYESYLEQDVSRVNTILSNIQELNVSIRNADIRGDDALELRDQRNLLLDELSGYMKIDVKYTTEDVGAGLMVEKLTVSLATGDKNTLLDGEYAAQLGTDTTDLDYPINLYALRDLDGNKKNAGDWDPQELGDTDLYGSIQSLREILTEKGEYATTADVANDPDASVKRGIPYYQNALDSLAREFAEQMNALNTAPGVTGQGNLFSIGSNSDVATDADGHCIITAANISVSQSWGNGSVSMIASRDPNASSGDTSNLAAFLNLFDKKQTFDPKDVAGNDAVGSTYSGTFEDMLLRIESTLAEDQMTTGNIYENYTITSNEAYTDRDSLSGVDLNDEASNLMVYQKAYTAACRLMTTLSDALDSLLAM